MSPRIGRPKIDNPKNLSIKVRFDNEMYTELVSYCNEHKITRTDAIRQGVRLLLDTEERGFDESTNR